MIKLVQLSYDYQRHLNEMMDEWWALEGSKIVPYAIRKNDYKDFGNYLRNLDVDEDMAKLTNLVPDVTYFALDTDRDIFVGAVNIRKFLNEKLLKYGGHIGYGVRPSERNKGFGTKILSLALEKCHMLGISKVLMTCDASNVASAKVIQNNGGIMENEILEPSDLNPIQRYWIDLR